MNSSPPTLSLRDRFYLGLLRFLARLPLAWLQRLGAGVGYLARFLPGITPVFVARRNLELCFPDQSKTWVQRTALACLQANAITFLEFAKCWGMPPAYSISMIRQVHGEDIFKRALAGGKGTIALVPHFGNWEFMNAWTNQFVHTTIMYKPTKEPGVDAFVHEARSRLDATLVATDESGVRALLKALKRNGFAAILPDHVPQIQGGVYAEFFGIETLSTVLASKLWQRTHCAVIVMFALRRAAGEGFDLYFQEPDADFFSDDINISVRGMNRTLENVIRLLPSDYQWAYKRFKETPNLLHVYDRERSPEFLKPHPASRHFQ
ncbi:MAG: lysophospholipid acyltransferase family protein [Pseudomonadales bacterium]|nr:lysophospholipid acyltransferase family protein [Pseudomonadales bacterium]